MSINQLKRQLETAATNKLQILVSRADLTSALAEIDALKAQFAEHQQIYTRTDNDVAIVNALLSGSREANEALKAQLAEAGKVNAFRLERNNQLAKILCAADDESLTDAAERVKDDLAEAEAASARLKEVLEKVEAWMSGEDGPIYQLWDNGDIGDYDDTPTNWEQTLFDVRDWKNGCVPTASLGYGTEWPAVTLYREILAALAREGGGDGAS